MKVLFVGNSHTFFNDMPALFAEMAEKSTGEKCEAHMITYGGKDLSWHRTEYFSLRYALVYGGYDLCVLQESAHSYPPQEATLEFGSEIADMCAAVGTKPVVYMTWAEKKLPEGQQKMTETAEKLAARTGALLCRVGQVWQKIVDEHPEIDLFYADGAHASPYGDFLVAASFCKLLAGRVDPSVSGAGKSIFTGKLLSEMDRARLSLPMNRAEVCCTLDREKTDIILEAVNAVI